MNDSYHIEELEIRISNYLSGNCTEEEKESSVRLSGFQ